MNNEKKQTTRRPKIINYVVIVFFYCFHGIVNIIHSYTHCAFGFRLLKIYEKRIKYLFGDKISHT